MLGSIGGSTVVALRGNARWRGYPALSVAAALGSFIFLFVLVFALEIATTLGIYGELAVLLVWVEIPGRSRALNVHEGRRPTA